MATAFPPEPTHARPPVPGLSPNSSVGPLDRLVQVAAQVARAPLACITLAQGRGAILLAGHWAGESFGDPGGIPVTHDLCQRVIDTGQSVAVAELAEHLPLMHDLFGPQALVSYLGVPLSARGGQVVGSFCVADIVARAWTADDRRVLESLALAVLTELDTQRVHLQLTESSTAYRDLLDITTELVCVADSAGTLTYVNRAWQEAFGFASDAALGRRAVDLVCPEHRGRFVEVARRLREGELIKGFEVVAIGEGSRRIVCRGNATASGLYVNGQFRCVSTRAVYQDVTNERRAQAARARLVATLEATTDFVGIAKPDGEIEYINRAGRALLGLSEDADISTLSAHEFHSPETLELLATEGFPTTVREGSWTGDGTLLTKGGDEIPVSIVMTAHPSLSPEEPSFFSAIMRDRRQKMAAAAALRQSNTQLSLIYHHVSDLLSLMRVEYDTSGALVEFRCESVNDAVLRATGATLADFVDQRLIEIAAPERYEELRHRYVQTALTGVTQQFEYATNAAGTALILETTLTAVQDAHGHCTHILGASRDVTARRTAEATIRRNEATFRTMLQSLRAIAVMLDVDGRLTFANEALLALTGWRSEQVLNQDWFTRFVPRAEETRAAFHRIMQGTELVLRYENEIITSSGRFRLIAWDNTVMRDADGRAVGVASIGQDITDQRALEEQLAEMAQRDELTGLFNRRGFVDTVELALTDMLWHRKRGALLCIDLDRFKPINDRYGHAAGDDALRSVSDLLQSFTNEHVVAGRLGGDEFALFVLDVEARPVRELLELLYADLAVHNRTAAAAGRPYTIDFSVGVAEAFGNVNYDQLTKQADDAMYRAKRERSSTSAVQQPSMT